jgi:hypothetical protein
MPKEPLPAVPPKTTLDRATLDRVLARAAELQTESPSSDPAELLSEEQLLEIGKEVGLSRTTLTQALAEERSRLVIPESGGFVSSVAGPAVATASRTLTGTADDILFALDSYMRVEECLQVQRRFKDRMVWEARGGVLGVVRRGLNINGRGFHLCKAQTVAATVVPVDEKRVVVRLDADLRESRSARLKGSGAAATVGTVASFSVFGLATIAHVAVVLSAGLAVVPLGAGALIAYEVARRHRNVYARVQLAFEQALDRLEHTGPKRLK